MYNMKFGIIFDAWGCTYRADVMFHTSLISTLRQHRVNKSKLLLHLLGLADR
jgi:hypothetical protein